MASNRVLTTSRGTNTGAFAAVDWVLLGSLGLIWGSSFLFMAIGLDSFHPGLVTTLRIAAAAIFFACLPQVRATKIEPGDRARLVALSFFWVVLPFTLFPIAQQWITSGMAGMLNGTTPIFATILTAVLLRSLPGRTQMMGVLVGFTGVILISWPSVGNGANALVGVLLALLASASYGLSVTIAVPVLQKYGSLSVMGRMVWIAVPMVLPYGIYGLSNSAFSWASFSATVAVGLLGTGLAFILVGILASRVGSSRATFTTYIIPIVALLLGAIVRDERIAALVIPGIALVLIGAFLASRREK